MKILWAANTPWCGSGYGVQSELFTPALQALGHDVAFYATWGLQGGCLDYQGMRVYPSDGQWGNRTMLHCAAHHGDGLENTQIIALLDAWVLHTDGWPDDTRMAIWAPVDHWPLPPASRRVLSHPCVRPIAMARFGERMMQEAGLDPLYVPHGVETDVFKPLPDHREPVRAALGLPQDAYVVGMVAANTGSPDMHRKAFAQQFQAFARFREKHQDAVLFAHTNEYASDPNTGLNLRQLASACGIPRSAITFTEVFAWELGLKRSQLASLYSAFDVYLGAAMGEGFGVPIIEAQACGLPVIITDHSAMTELCGAGWLVDGEDWYAGRQEAWLKSPAVASIVEALECAYQAADDAQLRQRAREFALEYDVDAVTEEFWVPALEHLGESFEAPREVPALVLPGRAA